MNAKQTNPSPQARPYDLVVLDLDGTILDPDHHRPISDRVGATIAAVQARGIPVTIGTGRTLDYVRQYIAHLGIVTPVLTTQGAVIGDPVSGKILQETTIPLDLAREAVAWLDAQPYIIALYFNDDEGHIEIVQSRSGDEQDFYDHVFGHPRREQHPIAPLVTAPDARPPLKFIIVEDERTAGVDLVQELSTRFSPRLTITRTHARLVEGTARGVDKGTGLLHLCELLSVDPARVLAVGDSDNDIPMLQTAGTAVAMGNASPGVLAVADHTAPPVDQDGAAVIMERLILDSFTG